MDRIKKLQEKNDNEWWNVAQEGERKDVIVHSIVKRFEKIFLMEISTVTYI